MVTSSNRALTLVLSAARMWAPSARGRRLSTLTMALWKGPLIPPEQDQQKSRQHIGVVVGVIGRANPEGRCNHQLPNQATHLAQQGAEGHHQCDPLQ